jgi:predicted O-linked N-acetylglucosamine transferase (SPINDLY family)
MVVAHGGLGVVLAAMGEMDEAISALRQAAALAPEDSAIQNNLGVALKKAGLLDEAIACYEEAMRLRPDNAMADSNRVYALYFHPDYDSQAILREHLVWNQRQAEPLGELVLETPFDRDPERRLRIGLVSPDFREHVVGRGILPYMEEHDRQKVEIFCYSNNVFTDELTARIRSHADHWRDIFRLNDEVAAELIRSDQIDILVDLSLHMSNNRLLIFARKPAPVQATYLGYCGTTGVRMIDFRLSDPHLDPPETDLSCYSEKTVRVPTSYWCYVPGGQAPDVQPAPAASGAGVTFGCLNTFAKMSPAAMDLWAAVLAVTPGSRMILHCSAGSHREMVYERFARHAIERERLELIPTQGWLEYMQTYHRIDIALDPIPYGGGITTCDGLWMGVPLVTLSGHTAVGRGGRTILTNVGLPELVAHSNEEYVRIASQLAGDLPRLNELRATLRQRMKDSALMDARRFARDIDGAFRQMWKESVGQEQSLGVSTQH